MPRRLTDWIAAGSSVAATIVIVCCAPSDPPPNVIDTDGDGLSDSDEIFLYGTSPVLADTDGDGWNDFAEIVTQAFDPANDPYHFNPRVADVPMQTITFGSPPDITIQFTVDNGTVHTFETSNAAEQSVSDSTTNTNENSQSNTIDTPQTATQETSVSAEVPQDTGDGGAGGAGGSDGGTEVPPVTVTNTESFSSTYDPSTTVESSVALSEEQTQEYSQTLTQAESFAQSNDVTESAGFVRTTAIVRNRGHVAFRVSNITLTATVNLGPTLIAPVDNLAMTEATYTTFQPFTLFPGQESGPLNFITDALNLQAVEEVLANVPALAITMGVYELDDPTGKAYAFNFTDIGSKTASVNIDYGEARSPESYLVATNSDPAQPGVSMSKVFSDILRIPYDADPQTGLTVVRDVGSNTSGSGNWVIWQLHTDSVEPVTTLYDATDKPYDFTTIQVHAGDALNIDYHGEKASPSRSPTLGSVPLVRK